MRPRVTVNSVLNAPSDLLSQQDVLEFQRMSNTLEQRLIDAQVRSVVLLFERLTRRNLLKRAISIWYDHVPGHGYRNSDDGLGWWNGVVQGARVAAGGAFIEAVQPPTISIDAMYTYDLANIEQLYDPSLYITDCTDVDVAGRLILNIGSIWPPNLRRRNAIRLDCTVGYDPEINGAVPDDIIQAIKFQVSWIFNNRGDASEVSSKTSGAYAMIRPYIMIEPMTRNDGGRVNSGI